jgi:hypothetical protein
VLEESPLGLGRPGEGRMELSIRVFTRELVLRDGKEYFYTVFCLIF